MAAQTEQLADLSGRAGLALMSRRTRRLRHFLLSLLLITACFLIHPVHAADSNYGVLEIQIKDHREAIDDFSKLSITIDKVLISPKPGLKFWQTVWKELTPSAATIDLTQYTGKKTVRIYRGEVRGGAFDGFDLKIKTIDAVLKKGRRAAPVKNTVGPIKLSFEVPAKGETLLVLDLVVMDFSDHPPRGYELGIGGYELSTNGKMIEKVPPG